MTANAEDILGTAALWLQQGERVAIATVVRTWGSSPRPAGSQMAVTASGRMEGSVSGGCIEGAVAEAAQRSMASGAPQLLDFGISNERAWEVGLACGGKLEGVRGTAGVRVFCEHPSTFVVMVGLDPTIHAVRPRGMLPVQDPPVPHGTHRGIITTWMVGSSPTVTT